MAKLEKFPPLAYSCLFVPYMFQAANKANSPASELANVLNHKDQACGSPKKFSRKKMKQFAKNAFGSCRNKIPEDQNGNSGSQNTLPHLHDNVQDNLTLLQLLALNALDLTAPASNVLLRNRADKWVQLSGHEDSFAPAGPGTLWKKCNSDCVEVEAYTKLMSDILVTVVPRYYKDVEFNGERFIEMQDLLYNFKDPSIMDLKMGTRTFLESEVKNCEARGDLYEKMLSVDPNAPTLQERESRAITKLRYMQFRENQSSSSELGFRIDGLKVHSKQPMTDFKQLRLREDVCHKMKLFLNGLEKIRIQLISQLQSLRIKLENSPFFYSHEIIGSSILIVHDGKKVGAWMIDFAKTLPAPEVVTIDHKSKWEVGNREDGYLIGLDNLISILKEMGKSKKSLIKN